MRKFVHRHIHFDFHTNGDITDVGAQFDECKFKKSIIKSNAQSATIFAKCHHSYCYYPTKVGTRHPHLNFDLSGAMLKCLHSIGKEEILYSPVG